MIGGVLDRFNQEDEDEQRRLQDEREDPGGPGGGTASTAATPGQVALVVALAVLVYKVDADALGSGVAARGGI